MGDDATTSPARSADGRTALRAEQIFAGHEILREAGRGGMGVVYAALHRRLQVKRALKVLNEEAAGDPVFRARFELESQAAAALEHPNIVPVYEAGESEGRLYLSMRFVDGPSLRQVLAQAKPLDVTRAVDVVGQLAAALDAAHAYGVVHRDVKPANVLLEASGVGERAFLGDFGISRLLIGARELTETGQMLGTVDYVAPEQLAGAPVDARSDVYSLACVAYEGLTGAAPFARETQLATMFAHANEPRPSAVARRSELPKAIDQALARAFAIDPADRYDRASDFAEALARAASGRGADRDTRRHASRRRRTTRVAALVALPIAAAVAIVALDGGSEEGEPPAENEAPPALAAPPAEAVATVDVVSDPVAIAVGELNTWTASKSGKAISAIVPATNESARPPVTVEGTPVSLAAAFGSIWVVDRGGDSLLRLDPGEASVPIAIAVGAEPSDVAFSASHLWVTNEADDTVSRIDPNTNEVDATVPVGDGPASVAVGEGGIWVANRAGGTITELDPTTAASREPPIQVGGSPTEVVAGEAGVWVVDAVAGRLRRLGPGSREVSAEIEVGGHPLSATTGFGYAWASLADGTVRRIDPTRLAAAGDPIPVGDEPVAMAGGKGFIWTANRGDSTVTRIQPRALAGP